MYNAFISKTLVSKKDQYTDDRNIAQQISGKAVKIASHFICHE